MSDGRVGAAAGVVDPAAATALSGKADAMADELAGALRRLRATLAERSAPVLHALNPGMPAAVVVAELEAAGLPVCAPLVGWFGWADGAAVGSRLSAVELVPHGRPLSLADALAWRASQLNPWHRGVRGREADVAEWPAHWLPLLTDDAGALIVFSCAMDSGSGPLLQARLDDPVARPVYDGLTAMARTAEDCWRSGAYMVNDRGRIEVAGRILLARITARHNPETALAVLPAGRLPIRP